jgi:hypothetical protein
MLAAGEFWPGTGIGCRLRSGDKERAGFAWSWRRDAKPIVSGGCVMGFVRRNTGATIRAI